MARHNVDVVVVGGGGMGSAAAWRLAGRGADVVLLERFEPGHVRGASHGASRIFRVSYGEPVYIRLAREAHGLWRELEAESGVPLLTVTGSVNHGLTLTWTFSPTPSRRPGCRASGWPPRRPPSAGPVCATRARSSSTRRAGGCTPTTPSPRSRSAAAALGAVVRHRTPVVSIAVKGEDAVDVFTGDDVYHAKRVVVAAGALGGQAARRPQ